MNSDYLIIPVYASEVKAGMYLRPQGLAYQWKIANNIIRDSYHVVGIEWYGKKGFYDWFYEYDQFDQLLHTRVLY